MNRPFPPLPVLVLVSTLGACGGGSGGKLPGAPFADPEEGPTPLRALQGDPERLEAIPDVIALEVVADSGLQLAYTSPVQRGHIDPLYVDAEWQHMQSCVGIVAPPPLIIVVEGKLEPLGPTDDVLRDLDGRITASAGSGSDGTAILQVHEGIFDGSFASPGFELRAIMGRHLWFSARLPERDYPYLCARRAAPRYP